MFRLSIRKRSLPINQNDAHSKSRKLFPLHVPKRSSLQGCVWVCGSGSDGQLGLGWNSTVVNNPKKLMDFDDAVEVCAGGRHTLVLTSDGKVFSFGCNAEGALGRYTSHEKSEYEPGIVELARKAVMITAGYAHSACLLENGTVMAWGSFRDSQGSMGLTAEGNKLVPYNLMSNIKCCSIASGNDHLVILSCEGHVYTVGCGEQGQLGRITMRSASGKSRRGKSELLRPKQVNAARLKLVKRIWATGYCTFVQEAYGGRRIFGFGLNKFKQLLSKSDDEIIACPIVLKLNDVKKIAGGDDHTIVLKNDGTIHAAGRYFYGCLGAGETGNDLLSLTPVKVFEKLTICDVNCGPSTTFLTTANGELYDCEQDVVVPKLVQIESNVKRAILRVSNYGGHTVFIAPCDDGLPKLDEIESVKGKAKAPQESPDDCKK